MNSFPAFFPLAGRRVVIAGEGEPAQAKARLFEGSPAELVRISAADGADANRWRGAALAFVATTNGSAAEACAAAARTAGVPLNVVDRPELCDFVTPAVIDRGDVVAAIGTGGTAPILASLLRGDIEARVPEGAGRIAALLGRMQGEVRAAYPDLAQRRAFLRTALSGPAADAAVRGETDVAEALLREAIAKGGRSSGAVRIVDGSGPADLLTLRAARALFEADVLVIDPEAALDVIALARRDAVRTAPAEVDMAALLADGLQVVWIVGPAGTQAAAITLGAEGIVADIVP
jgi:precorrin-2 dehydrogenase/sirohydrochlorin ferrochelatase